MTPCLIWMSRLIAPGYRLDMIFLFIPVLVQQANKKLLHGHLPDPVHIQVRQDTRYIIKQDPVAAHNIEILRAETLLIIIQNVGYSVHCHSGLSGACNTLYNDIVIGGFAYNFILLLLDSRHDLTQHRLLILGKILHQQVVVGHNLSVKIADKPPFIDFIGPLKL